MPETAVHEKRDLELGEDEIRSAENGRMPPPAGDALRPEDFCQRQFCVLVPATPNPRHDFGTFSFGKDVVAPRLLTR
jgi:hypothetical protein